MGLTSGPTLTVDATVKTATLLSSVLPGFGQLALGKNRTGVAFIGTFCFLAFLHWPLRLPRSYFGLLPLLFAMEGLFVVSACHALLSPSLQSPRASRWAIALVLPVAFLSSFEHCTVLSLSARFP